MKAGIIMATPCEPKSLHGKGEKWFAQHLSGPDFELATVLDFEPLLPSRLVPTLGLIRR